VNLWGFAVALFVDEERAIARSRVDRGKDLARVWVIDKSEPAPISLSIMPVQIDPHTMSSGDVGRVLGVTDERVRQLDDQLKPIRRANGRRYYDPRVVESVANERARK
jgi:hypothetical protein